jgi:hypothetical protein
VQHENAIFGDIHKFGERGHIFLDINDSGRVIAKDPKQVMKTNVN